MDQEAKDAADALVKRAAAGDVAAIRDVMDATDATPRTLEDLRLPTREQVDAMVYEAERRIEREVERIRQAERSDMGVCPRCRQIG